MLRFENEGDCLGLFRLLGLRGCLGLLGSTKTESCDNAEDGSHFLLSDRGMEDSLLKM